MVKSVKPFFGFYKYELFFQEPNPDLPILEKRQEKILSQLAELKQQIATLFDVLKSTNRPKSSVEVVSKVIDI